MLLDYCGVFETGYICNILEIQFVIAIIHNYTLLFTDFISIYSINVHKNTHMYCSLYIYDLLVMHIYKDSLYYIVYV